MIAEYRSIALERIARLKQHFCRATNSNSYNNYVHADDDDDDNDRALNENTQTIDVWFHSVGEIFRSEKRFRITEDVIANFARLTKDEQWIHFRGGERGGNENAFEGIVAHGFLTLSLLTFLVETVEKSSWAEYEINCGVSDAKFVKPVFANDYVGDAETQLVSCEWKKNQTQVESVYRVKIFVVDVDEAAEAENKSLALSALWTVRQVLKRRNDTNINDVD